MQVSKRIAKSQVTQLPIITETTMTAAQHHGAVPNLEGSLAHQYLEPTPADFMEPESPPIEIEPPTKAALDTPAWVHFVAGGLGGALGAAVTGPMEVVKTRLQSSNYNVASGNHHGIVHFLKHIKRTEGTRALWKGLLPTLVGVTPSRAVYFMVYSQTKTAMTTDLGIQNGPTVHMTAAAAAALSAATFTNPLWVIKTRLQLSETAVVGEGHGRQLGLCVKQLWREGGIKAFYRGLTASYFGTAETIVQFVIYERLKEWAAARPDRTGSHSNVMLESFLLSGVSKLIACVSAYPHEVVRTRMREPVVDGVVRYARFIPSLRYILKNEGIRGWYSGISAHLARVIPNTAVMFMCYELSVRMWSHHANPTTN